MAWSICRSRWHIGPVTIGGGRLADDAARRIGGSHEIRDGRPATRGLPEGEAPLRGLSRAATGISPLWTIGAEEIEV